VSIQQDGSHDGSHDGEAAVRSRLRSHRRKQMVVAAVGLAALLGGGAFVVTEARTAEETIVPDEAHAPPAPAPAPTPAPAVSEPPLSVRSSGLPAARVSRTSSPEPETLAERIAQLQASARMATDQVGVPLGPSVIPDSALTVSRSGTSRTGTLKVVSALADLTGQQELAWVAGPGDKVGDAECSQRIRLSADVPVLVHPTLLLCWKTSAAKSVYTLAVSPKGKPSAQASVDALDRQWATLG
jgi:hypothetical protein